MDFTRQCKRFLNYRTFNGKTIGKSLSNISTVGLFKTTGNNYRLVIADNDSRCLFVLNESDGQLIKELAIDYTTFGLCCTNKNSANFIYVCDYDHGVLRKYDENLKEVKQIKVENLSGPCGVCINYELGQIQLVDQLNNRIVFLDLQSEQFVSDFKLFQEDLASSTKHVYPVVHDLSAKINFDDHVEMVKKRVELDFRPFGVCTRNERFYITDWLRGYIYIYKNNVLEKKCLNKTMFRRPRDVILDSLGNILVTDLDKNSMFILDNKGTYLFETKVPKYKNRHEKGIFGVVADTSNNKLIFASNTSVYVIDLIN